jgi:hypothetical protein
MTHRHPRHRKRQWPRSVRSRCSAVAAASRCGPPSSSWGIPGVYGADALSTYPNQGHRSLPPREPDRHGGRRRIASSKIRVNEPGDSYFWASCLTAWLSGSPCPVCGFLRDHGTHAPCPVSARLLLPSETDVRQDDGQPGKALGDSCKPRRSRIIAEVTSQGMPPAVEHDGQAELLGTTLPLCRTMRRGAILHGGDVSAEGYDPSGGVSEPARRPDKTGPGGRPSGAAGHD